MHTLVLSHSFFHTPMDCMWSPASQEPGSRGCVWMPHLRNLAACFCCNSFLGSAVTLPKCLKLPHQLGELVTRQVIFRRSTRPWRVDIFEPLIIVKPCELFAVQACSSCKCEFHVRHWSAGIPTLLVSQVVFGLPGHSYHGTIDNQ